MYDLVPLPRRIEALPGSCDLSKGAQIRAPQEASSEASLLASWLEASLGARFPLAPSASAGLAQIELRLEPGLGGKEEYRLSIAPGAISLSASAPEGLVRGAASLWQLALSEGAKLPCLRIEDGPRFPWRGFMGAMAQVAPSQKWQSQV